MLRCIEINEIALIDAASIEFDEGLCVLTGETGAGKSIVIDSINAALGARVQRDIVRQGAERATATAAFEFSADAAGQSPGPLDTLRGLGVDAAGGYEAILSREIMANGRSVCRINGRLVPSHALRAVGELAVDLHGQHDNHSLLKRDKHARLVDGFGGKQVSDELAECGAAHSEFTALRRDLRALREGEAARARDIDMLSFQLSEIRAARITPKEDELAEAEARMLKDAEKVGAALSKGLTALLGAGFDAERAGMAGAASVSRPSEDAMSAFAAGPGALERVQEAGLILEKLAPYSQSFLEAAGMLREASALLEDASETAMSALGGSGADTARLDALNMRLELLGSLKKKYGGTLKAVHGYYRDATSRLTLLRGSEAKAAGAEAALARARARLDASARRLTALRQEASKVIERDVAAGLSSLGMPGASLSVSIESSDDPDAYGPDGRDAIEFLFSANRGEEPRPLTRIASGGEMSRVMLAVKSVLADADSIPTMIFDEIDAGVGGVAASRVAERLCLLSSGRQIICVTHLAQIASMADAHYKIEKGGEMRAATTVRRLGREGRVEELSRILGGDLRTDASLALARDMLERAERFKAEARGR